MLTSIWLRISRFSKGLFEARQDQILEIHHLENGKNKTFQTKEELRTSNCREIENILLNISQTKQLANSNLT